MIPTPITDCSQIPPQYKSWRRLCEENEAYRRLWFEGYGPGQHPEPGIISKAARYTKAVGKHVVTGGKKRPPKEIDRIYDTICKPCRLFNSARGTCTICGCCVNKSRAALRNKIAMASQHCPRKKW